MSFSYSRWKIISFLHEEEEKEKDKWSGLM